MTMEQWFTLIGVVLAIGLAVYNLYSNGKRPTLGTVVTEVGSALGQVDALTKAAREAVQAAEQLWNTGQIPHTPEGGKDPRFLKAFDVIQKQFPDLDDAVLESSLEGAVFWLKYIAPSFMAKLPPSMQTGVQGTGNGMMQGTLELSSQDHVHVIDTGDSRVAKPTPESLSGLPPQ